MRSRTRSQQKKTESKKSGIEALRAHSKSGDLENAFGALKENVEACAEVQNKILKFLVGGMFDKLNGNLGMDDEQSAFFRENVLGLVSDFKAKNISKSATPGTLRNTVLSLQQFEPLFAALLTDGPAQNVDKDSVKREEALKRDLKKMKKEKEKFEKEKKDLLAKNVDMSKQLASIGKKQMDLAQANIEMEEKVLKLEKSNADLEQKSQMSDVFEQGLNDLKRMLDNEVEDKQKLEEQIAHLTQLQMKYKLTWIPPKSCSHCMSCREKFKMFGNKSKHYCRHCGRMYCKDCSTMMPLPEFGFREPVRVCTPCFDFKKFIAGGGDDD